VDNVASYALFRFLAGVGLAGEVGAAMTIAAEATPRKYRAYGTAAVSGLGVMGAIAASFVGDILHWRTAFITAGLAGLVLLFARMSMKETLLFTRLKANHSVERGSLRLLLSDRSRAIRLMRCVLAAVPLWFAIGIVVSFAPEIARNPEGRVLSVAAVAMAYSIGETSGEVACGILSQLLRSRKTAMFIFLLGASISALAVLKGPAHLYATLCLPLGFFVGYWGVVVTSTAEQFGTNLRATATTIVPNLVRASAIPITFLFSSLCQIFGNTNAAILTGGLCFLIAFLSIAFMDETFQKDLDFVEV
jgi:MFS family permease